MAGAMNSAESKPSFVGFPVASNLTFDQVLFPFTSLVPVERGDPVLGSNCTNSTISVT